MMTPPAASGCPPATGTAKLRIATQGLLEPLAVALMLLLAALFLLRTPLQAMASIELGASDRSSVAGFHPAELGEGEEPLRWTDGDATIRLPAQGAGSHVLDLRLAAPQSPPPAGTPVAISVNGRPLAGLHISAAPRHYLLLVPATALHWDTNSFAVSSPTFVAPRDERTLGVAVFLATLTAIRGQGWLHAAQLATLALAACLLWLALARLGAGAATRLLVVFLFLLIGVAMRQSDLRFVPRWSGVVLTAGLAAGFGLAALPRASRNPQRGGAGVLLRGWWPAVALYAGFTALLYWQMWPHFTTHIFGGQGDNYEYAWKLQWFAEALAGGGQSPVFVPQSFFPVGYELGMSEITPAHTLLGLPLTLAFGPAASFNSLVFLSYTLTALVAAMYAERLGAPRLGALVAGVGVSFCVYRFAHTVGLIPQLGTQWVLLALYGWEGFLQRRRSGDAMVAAIGLALACWSSMYYGATLAPLMALYTLLRVSPAELRSLLREWRALLLAAVIVIALVAPYAQPFVQAQALNEQRRFSYETLLLLAAQPADFFNPNPFHPLRRYIPIGPPKQYIALGLVLTALATVGLWRHRRSRAVWAIAGVGLAGFVLALGPELAVGDVRIPLPVGLIYEHVAVLQSIRAWYRLAFYLQIATAGLAALAFTGWRAGPRWRRAVLMAAAVLVLFESAAAPRAESALGPRPVDQYLAGRPGGSVIQIPDTIGGHNLYYSLHHGHPIAVGYGTYFPATYHENIWHLIAFPVLPETVPLYQRLGVEYVLVHKPRMAPEQPWREQAAALGDVTLVYEDEQFVVYQVRQLIPPWRQRQAELLMARRP